MKIGLLGFGKSSKALIEWLLKNNHQAKCSDIRALEDFTEHDQKLIETFKQAGCDFELERQSVDFIRDCEFVMMSPGIPPSLTKRFYDAKINLVSDYDLFCKFLAKPEELICITGTNGKTTTTSFIAHLLESEAIGNIGKAFFHASHKPYVCELSSAQLFYSQIFTIPKVAVFLNFQDDHMDWHSDMQEYFESKAKLFPKNYSQEKNYWIINWDDAQVKDFALKQSQDSNTEIFFFSTKEKLNQPNCAYLDGDTIIIKSKTNSFSFKINELNIVGEHNYSNSMAAVLAANCFNQSSSYKQKLSTFKAIEHRLEFVCAIEGKKFYNDSKATNPISAKQAYDAFESCIAIVGGKNKNLELKPMIESLVKNAKYVFVIGEIQKQIVNELKNELNKNAKSIQILQQASLEDCIQEIIDIKEELPVIFSPGSSSFDMFKNYEERGKVFKNLLSKFVDSKNA